MRHTFAFIGAVSIFAVGLGSCARSGDMAEHPILDKQSAVQMFAFSSFAWMQNVAILKNSGIGRSVWNPDRTVSLVYRPDPRHGLLTVTPHYKPSQVDQPYKISVRVTFDQSLERFAFETMSFSEIKHLLESTARYMRPEFSVKGYLVRDRRNPPSVHFTIFRNGDFPSIDRSVDQGNVCPPRNGEQDCILETAVGTSADDERMLSMCVSRIKGDLAGIGKSEDEAKNVCSCVLRMARKGESFEDVQRQCFN